MNEAIMRAFEQFPVAAVAGIFAWFLFRLVERTLLHYQAAMDRILEEILPLLVQINERTTKCIENKLK